MMLQHDGKGRPVDRLDLVDVKFADGEVFVNLLACLWNWGPYRPDVPAVGRIIEYRVRDKS